MPFPITLTWVIVCRSEIIWNSLRLFKLANNLALTWTLWGLLLHSSNSWIFLDVQNQLETLNKKFEYGRNSSDQDKLQENSLILLQRVFNKVFLIFIMIGLIFFSYSKSIETFKYLIPLLSTWSKIAMFLDWFAGLDLVAVWCVAIKSLGQFSWKDDPMSSWYCTSTNSFPTSSPRIKW